MRGKLHVVFHGEEGVDAGGVTREWYQVSWANTAISLLPFLYFRVTCCSTQCMQSIMQYVLEEAAPHTCECLDHASGVDCWVPPGHALSGMLEKLCV